MPPSRSERLSQLLRRPELWVFLFAFAARLAGLFRFADSPHFGVQGGDTRFYHEWALRILHGRLTDHHAFYGLPGYPFLLAGLYAVFGVQQFPVLALQCALDACTAVLVFALARKAVLAAEGTGDLARPALIVGAAGALGWICFIPAQSFALILMPTGWLVAAYWGCFWLTMRLRERDGVWPWAWLGAAIGATAMMVATILFLIPLALAANFLRVRAETSWRTQILAAAALLGGVFAGTAPAWVHNCFIAREPVFLSAHGGINFWIGNHPEADGYPKIPAGLRTGQQELLDDSIQLAEKAAGRPLTRPEVSRYWSAKAWGAIHENPARWLRLLGLKLRAFWNVFQYDDLTIIALLREEGVLLPGFGFGFAAALGLAGIALALPRPGPGRWIAAAVLLHMLALMPVFVTERYRLAAVPGLLVLGACALWRLGEAARGRAWMKAATAAACIALGFALVFGPHARGALSSMEPYNLAIGELEAAERLRHEGGARREAQLARAERHLEEAQKFAPDNASLHFAWGRYWSERRDREKAKAAYVRAAENDPKFTDPLTNLAVMAMEEKQWAPAANLLQRAAAIAPNDPGTWYLLARARAEMGDTQRALTAIEQALRLAPGEAAFMELRRTLSPN